MMSIRFLVPTCLFAVAAALMALPTAAQSIALFGDVKDRSGSPIAGAAILVTTSPIDTGAAVVEIVSLDESRYAFTGPEGAYRIVDLESGPYFVAAYADGRRLATRPVTLERERPRVDFELSMLESDLGEITVQGSRRETFGLTRLQPVDVAGVAIYDARKTEVVMIDDVTANLATNNSRQVYSRVAGLNIWESDGAGVQLGLGGRGLSPNRNSNFNTRQNGYDIAADALGYPESYYTPPTRALDRIEIVRGAASLQYGTQFGGLVNFVFKEEPEEPFQFTSSQTAGSLGLVSSFNSVGGSTARAGYYGFYEYKRSDGWRPNSELDQHTAYASLEVRATPRLTIRPEFTYMRYLAKQPGGLTDAQFEDDPRQSNRARNWFRVDWKLLALRADYRISSLTSFNTRFFGLVGGRDALGNLGRIDRLDFGGPRDLLRDDFRNWGNETRVLHRYSFLGSLSVLLVGTRFYEGLTHRRQGLGPDRSDPEFDYLNPDHLEGSDFDLPSRNASVFAENIFHVTPRLSVTPGVRFEYIRTQADGYYRRIVEDLAGNVLSDERIDEERRRARSFTFFGLGVSYAASDALELYANVSQNYRAITFNDVRVNVGSLEVDPDISDERGYNADLGLRGGSSLLFTYDISLFHLSYQDRIGTVLRTEPNPQFNNLVDRTFRFRTNIADARIYGVESFAELDLYRALVDRDTDRRVSLFANVSMVSAEYVRSDEPGIEGKAVELVPDFTLRTGLTVATGGVRVTGQISYTGEHYSDASNALRTPTAIEGLIPSYHVADLSAEYTCGRYRLEAGVNNLTDHHYFTRRATGYPGPGIIPASGRSFYVGAGLTL